VAAVCRQGIAEHLPARLQQPGPDHPLGGFQAGIAVYATRAISPLRLRHDL
jgi:hypothetical protein